jgi:4-alpha-glucanotransferase
LPGPYGIGELGSGAIAWLDWLAGAGCSLWQVLPLGPTSYGDSPYQSFSSFAGNPNLISLERLAQQGYLDAADLAGSPTSSDAVDYGLIYDWKRPVLDRAYARFQRRGSTVAKAAFETFILEEAGWLDDFALFMALKDAHDGEAWNEWPERLRDRVPEVLQRARQVHKAAIRRQQFRQYIFFQQWQAVRSHAAELGILIIGDIPIFTAYDSAEVWANRDLFDIDPDGNPNVVAGVPPDYFSADGQLWGNPLYRWEAHASDGYAWWVKRLRAALKQFDILRLDHFRGFHEYWEVPADALTASNGRWVKGPGRAFFEAIRDAIVPGRPIAELPIIAEDLGELSPGVEALLTSLGFPGMKVLVFAFTEDAQNLFLPHHYSSNSVVYTGTHDNDTAVGWYERVDTRERDFARRYLARDGEDIAWDLIRLAWSSTSYAALAPVQDLLSLGNEARMNFPGREAGNWTWRLRLDQLTEPLQTRLHKLNTLYDRLSAARKD